MTGDGKAAGRQGTDQTAAAAARVEKLMSADTAEVARNWAELRMALGLAPGGLADPIPVGNGRVSITAVPQPAVRLGGLLELPRSLVRLDFHGVEDRERAAFIAAFDRAFQRGGG